MATRKLEDSRQMSKYKLFMRRCRQICVPVFVYFVFMCLVIVVDTKMQETSSTKSCDDTPCKHGTCQNDSQLGPVCECDRGWKGVNCHMCGGRVRINGSEGQIFDGDGNYTFDTKCTWLIEGKPNSTIRLRFEQMATECSWDHLYIYDGSSIFDPLIAVLSGLVRPPGSDAYIPEVVTRSGYAYLHFYSDAAYNMSGFHIAYKMESCPLDCSGHGYCPDDVHLRDKCICESGFRGDGCEIESCPKNCNPGQGYCSGEGGNMECLCLPGFYGDDCSIPDTKGHWQRLNAKLNHSPGEDFHGRASHKSIVIGSYLWVVGGYTFGVESMQKVYRINLDSTDDQWEEIYHSSGSTYPAARYGHSIIENEGKLYMFGGLKGTTITDELWEFHLEKRSWQLVDFMLLSETHSQTQKPLAVVGHTAHLIDGFMYIIFGHSPIYGYMNTVQECNMSAIKNYLQWKIHSTTGAVVKGGYGHSSVYDPDTRRIYVHAGYHSEGAISYYLADTLYEYDPKHYTWRILRSSMQSRYLHSAIIMNGLMLVYGGNTHNDSSTSRGARCFSNQFLAYHIKCDRWHVLDEPKLLGSVARFGHSAEVDQGKMYVFGGFSGVTHSDLLVYTPGRCQSYKDKESCLSCHEGVECVWAEDRRSCLTPEDAELQRGQKIISGYDRYTCAEEELSTDALALKCDKFKSCPSCVENTYGCTWCTGSSGTCRYGSCPSGLPIEDSGSCLPNASSGCYTLHNCLACNQSEDCGWTLHENNCVYKRSNGYTTDGQYSSKCPVPCHSHMTCENCTSASCMWCSNQQRCVESNSYIASFPYGQCMEWMTNEVKCPATRCSDLRTCEACQDHPACGWCVHGSNTGLGKCMEGGGEGPVRMAEKGAVVMPDMCPSTDWYFTDCPLCQCNGHSTCHNGTDECINCEDLTTGDNCEQCQDGYYGDATVGGNCTACDCNGQADLCNNEKGNCYCRTRGVIGQHCEKCDENSDYRGNPLDGGTCFYEPKTDFVYTFNMSTNDDAHLVNINFMNTPHTADKDVDFKINCSGRSFLNITVRSREHPEEKILAEHVICRDFRVKFPHKDYNFGREHNTTFFIYVYGFTTPFLLEISFSQYPHIDLLQFFVTFFSCFLALLLIAAIFWKLKQKYDMCRRRQMMEVEMEQRASRPFASAPIEINGPDSPTESLLSKKEPPDSSLRSKKKKLPSKPSPITLEPLHNQKAAVLSLVVQLPRGDDDYTPPGMTGVCFGSALVSLGHTRKSSVDHTKGDKTDRSRNKSGVTQNNCI